MAFYNDLTLSNDADSRGTAVEQPELLVGERPGAKGIIQAMDDYRIDIRNNRRVQLDPKELKNYDKIIVMAEIEHVPRWLADNPKVEYWDVLDIKDQPIEVARQLRDQILEHVRELLGYPSGEEQKKLV